MSEQVKLKDRQIVSCKRAASSLIGIGDWGRTAEGRDYWRDVAISLEKMVAHGTSDGKPYVEPCRIPTDEDAKQRPMVMVRDREGDEWTDEMVLLRVQGEGDYPFVAEETGFEECEVTKWKYCRFPTEAESKEMGQ